MNFGPPTAEIDWRVLGTPANFNGFRVFTSLMHRRYSTESAKLCTMFGRLLLAALVPNGILPRATSTLPPNLAFS